MLTPLRQLRHDLRGRCNTLMLCSAVLPIATDDNERLGFVNEIILAADKLIEVLDKLEAMPEHFADDGKAPS